MILNDAKDLVQASKETRLSQLQKQMIWESVNYQSVVNQFAKLSEVTQILLKFFHAVEGDLKVWKKDPSRAQFLVRVQEAYEGAKEALGPVSMIKPDDIFGETEVAGQEEAAQIVNPPTVAR